MQASRRTFLQWVTTSGIALGLSRFAAAQSRELRGTRDAAGTQAWMPQRPPGRPHRRRRQGHRRKALRLRLPCRRPPRLAAQHRRMPCWFARRTRPTSINGIDLGAAARRREAHGRGDRRGPRARRHTRARLLRRRPVLPGRQDAALSRPAGGAAPLRGRSTPSTRRGWRSRDGEFLNFGAETGPVRDAQLRRLALHPRRRTDAGRARCLFAAPGRLGQPRLFRERRTADLEAAADRGGGDYAKGATYGEEIRAELAADDPAVLVLDREFETQSVDPMFLEPESGLAWYDAGRKASSSCSACSRRTRPRKRSPICSARPTRRSSRRASTPISPMLGGGFGGRDHTPFPLYVALAAMFFPGRPVRLAHDRYQQFQGGIKRHAFKMRTPDRGRPRERQDHRFRRRPCARRRRPRQLFGAASRSSAPPRAIGIYDIPKVDVTTVARAFARRHRRLDARLRHAADHDGAGDAGRRGGRRAAARSDRVPPPQRAQDRRPDHDRQPLHRLGPHARDPRQAGEASDLAQTAPQRRRAASERRSGRHRRRLRHQGLRHRRRLLARQRWRSIPQGRITDPRRLRRDGQRHRHRAGQPGGGPSRRRRRRGHGRARSTCSTRSSSSPPATPTR